MTIYAFAENVVNWKDAANHYGKYKTIEGTIVSTKCFPKVCFLNFDKNYKKTVTVVIFASNLSKFPSNLDKFYLNKKVQVTGIIKEYKGKPEIIVNSPDQISILSATTSMSDKNPDEYLCFNKSELKSGDWKWNEDEKCVKRKYVACKVDESVMYSPFICRDIRNGWMLSFSD